jgi:hypothetical protein
MLNVKGSDSGTLATPGATMVMQRLDVRAAVRFQEFQLKKPAAGFPVRAQILRR